MTPPEKKSARRRKPQVVPAPGLPKARKPSSAQKKVQHPSPHTVPADRDPVSIHQLSIHQLEALEDARMQWQFGDWESLAKLDAHSLAAQPERATLALMAACAHQQLRDHAAARRMATLSRHWGCDRKLMARLLLASVHNTLGRAAALTLDGNRALSHFDAAVRGVSGDARLACQARSAREVARLGLYRQAGEWIERQVKPVATPIPQSAPVLPHLTHESDPQLVEDMQLLALECMVQDDVHAAADANLNGMGDEEALQFCIALSDAFMARNDAVTAAHFLAVGRQHAPADDPAILGVLARKLIATGQSAKALDVFIEGVMQDASLTAAETKSLKASYAAARNAAETQGAHGHEVLLASMRASKRRVTGAGKPVLIEIGSTREDIAGQGSTRIIAEYCQGSDIDFITVDMDPHNTASADALFRRLETDFRAVNAKGEDFLRDYPGRMDFVFLDAYDFDHGKHSDFRQSRYQKFLGSRIDERACHQMHLDCAQSVLKKLSPTGLVCIDDTWLTDGHWQAKGTLAVPFLLANGFELVEARNRAALLRRKKIVRGRKT